MQASSVVPPYGHVGEASRSETLKRVCGSITSDWSCASKLLNDAIERRNYSVPLNLSSSLNCTTRLLESPTVSDNITDVIMCAFLHSDDTEEEANHDLGGTLYSIYSSRQESVHTLTSWVSYLSIFD